LKQFYKNLVANSILYYNNGKNVIEINSYQPKWVPGQRPCTYERWRLRPAQERFPQNEDSSARVHPWLDPPKRLLKTQGHFWTGSEKSGGQSNAQR
jgi:hypothetical protein